MNPSESRNTLSNLLEIVLENEKSTRELYRSLSKAFTYVEHARQFLDSMEMDETSHIRILDNIRKSIPADQLNREAEQEEWERAVSASRILVDNPVDSIQNLDDAYELIHELEFNEINISLIDMVTQFITSDSIQSQILKKILEHQNKIIQFGDIVGNRAQRRQFLVRTDT